MTRKLFHGLRGPKLAHHIADRLIDCEQDLEPLVHQLIARARRVGWSIEEAAVAIASLADHYVLANKANEAVARQLSSIRDANDLKRRNRSSKM